MNIKNKKLFAAIILCSCAQVGIAESQPNLKYLNISNTKFKETPVPILGGGYSSDMQMPEEFSCLKDGTIEYIGGGKSITEFGDRKSFTEIESDLRVNVEAKTDIWRFSLDAAADYARHIKTDAYSEGVYYYENIMLPTKLYKPPTFGEAVLNDFGKAAYAAGPNQFRYSCGDEFISQEPLGVKFVATMKFNFASASDKATFNAHVNGKIGSIFSASAAIQQAISQYHISGDLEISAYQEGGNPTKLAKVFDNKCGEHYCVTQCSLDKIDSCKGVIDGIINYALDAKNGLPSQVDFKDGKVIGDPMPLGYLYTPYSKLVLNVGDSIITPEIQEARGTLADLYDQTLEKYNFVDHILNSAASPHIIGEAKDGLNIAKSNLLSNLGVLQSPSSGAVGCFLNPKNCVYIANTIKSNLKPVDEELISNFKHAYRIMEGSTPDTNIYMAPLGKDQYSGYYTPQGSGPSWTTQATILLINQGQDLQLDGIDEAKTHYTGVLHKIGTDTYQGNIIEHGVPVGRRTYQLVENPL